MASRLSFNTGRDLVIDTCDRMRIARLKAGIEQNEMAEILGVSASSISNWENGRNAPKLAFLNSWAQVTGYNLYSIAPELDPENDDDQTGGEPAPRTEGRSPTAKPDRPRAVSRSRVSPRRVQAAAGVSQDAKTGPELKGPHGISWLPHLDSNQEPFG